MVEEISYPPYELHSFVAGIALRIKSLAPPSNRMWVPVMCDPAGEARKIARPAMSEGWPYRPEGCAAVKASSPACLRPKAVILLGKRLLKSKASDRGPRAKSGYPGQIAFTLRDRIKSSCVQDKRDIRYLLRPELCGQHRCEVVYWNKDRCRM